MSIKINHDKIMKDLAANPDPENPFFMDAKGSGIRHDEIRILFAPYTADAMEVMAVFYWRGKETYRISCGPMPSLGHSISIQGIEGSMRVKLI